MNLSICFTVYNQSKLLEEQISKIIHTSDEDFEIVLSDDCSTEDIYGVVEKLNDRRIKYYKTPNNIGHDLNILHGLNHCTKDYVMILRTRDSIKVENIKSIYNIIQNNHNVGYFYFSADYEGRIRLRLRDRVFSCGKETMIAHLSLPEHPSGNIYNRKYLNSELYESYIKRHFDDRFGFMVDKLIRCDLSTKFDMLTSSEIGWVYADTLNANDVAVNNAGNGKNIYAPEYCYPRYKCIMEFCRNEIGNEFKNQYILGTMKSYYKFIVGKAPMILRDSRYFTHYNSKYSNVSRISILKEMNKITDEVLSDETKLLKKKAMFTKNWLNIYCLIVYPIKEVLRKIYIITKFGGKEK